MLAAHLLTALFIGLLSCSLANCAVYWPTELLIGQLMSLLNVCIGALLTQEIDTFSFYNVCIGALLTQEIYTFSFYIVLVVDQFIRPSRFLILFV